jgi:hypothetical protein
MAISCLILLIRYSRLECELAHKSTKQKDRPKAVSVFVIVRLIRRDEAPVRSASADTPSHQSPRTRSAALPAFGVLRARHVLIKMRP